MIRRSEAQRRTLAMAYRQVDAWGADVIIVWEPQTKYEYQDRIPYVVRASDADAYEAKHGQRVQYREDVG